MLLTLSGLMCVSLDASARSLPLGAVSASSIAEAISSISDTIQTSTEVFFFECFDSLPLNSVLRSKTTALASHLKHG